MTDSLPLRQALQQKQAVVFDLFHTLTAIELTSARNLSATHEILAVDKDTWNDVLRNTFRDRMRGLRRDSHELLTDMARTVRPDIPAETVSRALELRIRRFATALQEIPDKNIQVLRALRSQGKKLGLISNADIMEVQSWPSTQIPNLFDAVVFPCEVGHMKPEPRIYNICLERLGVKAENSASVGDGHFQELRGARALGFLTVMTTEIISTLWPEAIEEIRKDADYVISDLRELSLQQT